MFIIMKFTAIAALVATVSAGSPPAVGLGHAVIPATREDYDNAKELWKGDCSISESDNWKGAQQCSQSWECRGARLCERGGCAPDTTDVRVPHSQTKLQVSSQITDQ